MRNLFIIGNGFDRAHDLQTGYEDFHRYLKQTYPDADENTSMLPSVYQDQHGEICCNDSEAVGFLMRIITQAELSLKLRDMTLEELELNLKNIEQEEFEQRLKMWSALEKVMGELDYSEVFDVLTEPLDEDGDVDLWDDAYQNEDVATDLHVVIEKFSDYFADWIKTINIAKAKQIPSFKKLIESDDVFLNFNYTETLEVVYKVLAKNVCHIHGKQGEILILGHGRDEREEEYNHNMSYHTGAEDILSDIHRMLKKDTDLAIKKHEEFFTSLRDGINNIYSHGFSFGEVDQPYIKKICEMIPTENITWYLNDFDKSQLQVFEEQLRSAGFKGEISTFSI
ncbi:MAG: bacteriophage abortive infection AbiH family protein [Lachnospiraceae bacterium]|nr:bacteriophage abortive infection AbiH family protein [Lachnospiraceae bacterium]